jgi:hypothetical protein
VQNTDTRFINLGEDFGPSLVLPPFVPFLSSDLIVGSFQESNLRVAMG